MKLPLLSDRGLAKAIESARYNLRHPEQFLDRWQQNPSLRRAVIETQSLHLSLLLELQKRRALHGALDCTSLDAF